MEHCRGELGRRQKQHLRWDALSMPEYSWMVAGFHCVQFLHGLHFSRACISGSHPQALVACVYSQSLGTATCIQLSIKTKQSAVLCHFLSRGKWLVLICGESTVLFKAVDSLFKWFP